MDKIIIEVKGGVVQDVLSTNPDIQLELIDWDSIEEENDEPEIEEIADNLKEEIKNMSSIL